MNKKILTDTVSILFADHKGLLAMDESNSTCNKRFEKLNIAQTETSRRDWRELLVNTPEISECISGTILYDETIRQKQRDGTLIIKSIIDKGMIPGIKVDKGAKLMAGHPEEKITEGLDGLRERLEEYFNMGARFAKWRAVFTIGEEIPSRACIEANANALALYASLCQEAGLVPIVEPEVLMEGTHDLQKCFAVTEKVLQAVFAHLYLQEVMLEDVILKPNMVIEGLNCIKKSSADEVADATIQCLLQCVPAAVGGIAFLSGGQSGELASAHLNAMHLRYQSKLPWPLTFSFARAIQQPAMEIWHGENANIEAAQSAVSHRAKCDKAARMGFYYSSMEMFDEVII